MSTKPIEPTQEDLIRIAMMVHGERDVYASDLWAYVRDQVLEAAAKRLAEMVSQDEMPGVAFGLGMATGELLKMRGKP